MRAILAALIISLFATSFATFIEAAQTRRPPQRRRQPAAKPEPKPTARIIGTPVTLVTKNGDRIAGEILDLSAYSIKIRSSNLESIIALDTLASISFGKDGATSSEQTRLDTSVQPDFARDANSALTAFQTLSADLNAGIDYTQFGTRLIDLRRAAERFIDKYSASENVTEARVTALVAGALTDYTWSRTIWTLKLGRASDGTVSETDSPVLGDVLALYSDIRAFAATGDRYSADKIVGALWKKASEKVSRARALVTPSR